MVYLSFENTIVPTVLEKGNLETEIASFGRVKIVSLELLYKF